MLIFLVTFIGINIAGLSRLLDFYKINQGRQLSENLRMSIQSQKGNAAIVAVVVVLIAGAVWFLFLRGGDQSSNQQPLNEPSPAMMSPGIETNDEVTSVPTSSPILTQTPTSTPRATVSNVREFIVLGNSFKFNPAEIRVRKGDTVRIVFKNEGGMHNWVLDEFNAGTKTLQSGQTDTIEFVANKTGTFEYYCSVGNHRQMGMVGKLIVE